MRHYVPLIGALLALTAALLLTPLAGLAAAGVLAASSYGMAEPSDWLAPAGLAAAAALAWFAACRFVRG